MGRSDDGEVHDLERIHQPRGGRRGRVSCDPKRDVRAVVTHHLAECRQVSWRSQRDVEDPGRVDALGEQVELAVVDQPTAGDHQHPLGERLDIGHVVARQQDGGTRAPAVVGDEAAQLELGGHVEPERRFVEEQQLRLVQQGAHELDLHPFAERQVAHRLGDERPDVEPVDQLVAGGSKPRRRDAVDRTPELVRVERRQVPGEHPPVAHHQRDPAEEVVIAL